MRVEDEVNAAALSGFGLLLRSSSFKEEAFSSLSSVVDVPFCIVCTSALLNDFKNIDWDFQNDGSSGSFFSRAKGFSPALAGADMA